MSALEPRHVHPRRWREAVDVARETCARFFADGRSPADAVRAHGLAPSGTAGWAHAVNVIAELHCAAPDTRVDDGEFPVLWLTTPHSLTTPAAPG